MRMSAPTPVKKPVIPPLFFCACALWASCACVYTCLQGQSAETMLAVCALGLVVCAICLGLLWFKKQTVLFFALLGLGLGIACAGQAAFFLQTSMARSQASGVESYTFQIIEDVQDSDFGQYSLARATNSKGETCLVRVNLPREAQARCWDYFESTCAIQKPSRNAAAYYWRKGAVGSISPYRVQVEHPRGILGAVASLRKAGISVYTTKEAQAMGNNGAIFLRSIAFGDRTELFKSPLYSTVKRVGLAHIVAVSGAHLGITIAFIAALLRAFKTPRSIALVLQASVCVLYVLFTGAPHSAMRACLMVLCALFAFFGRRHVFALNALSVCIIAFICLEPRLCMSVSLVLSSLATCGIVLFSGYLSSWISALCGGRFQSLCDVLGLTLSAILATLPLTLTLFKQFSLIAPLANLFAAPLFSVLCVGGLLVALVCVLCAPLAFLANALVWCAEYFCTGLQLLARVPFAAIAVSIPAWASVAVFLAGVGTLFYFWPKPTRVVALWATVLCTSSLAVSIFLFPLAHGTEIIMLNVGQGDAFVLRSGGQALLIDTGNQDAAVLSGLARHDVRHLDAVLITHPDDDHCGSLATILDFVEVDRVLVAHDLIGCTCENCTRLKGVIPQEKCTGLYAGDTLSWGAFSAQVLAPTQFQNEGGNEDSLVLHIGIDSNSDGVPNASGFFCGDAEAEVLAQLQKSDKLVHTDILKVGHHGSGGAFNEDQLSVLSPRIALVSVGENNRYGHPNEETLALLEAAGAAIFRTDESGDVVCKFSGSTLNVETLR